MAKIQLRRTISLTPRHYLLSERLAERSGVSRSACVEALIDEAADDAGVAVTKEEVEAAKAQRRREAEERRDRLDDMRRAAFGGREP